VAKTITSPAMPAPVDIPENSQITDIDGQKVSNWRDIMKILWQNTGKDVVITYQTQTGDSGKATLKVSADANAIGEGSDFAIPMPFKDLRDTYKAKGALDAIAMGYDCTITFIAQTYVTLKQLLLGLISPKALMGPAGILKISYKIVEEKMWTFYLYFMGLISASIAVMNLLPFPVLDGGVITMMLIEKVKGSPISQRIQSVIAYTGLVLIMAFFLYVTWNDLTGMLFK
jgi:regulator of sigma E protease